MGLVIIALYSQQQHNALIDFTADSVVHADAGMSYPLN